MSKKYYCDVCGSETSNPLKLEISLDYISSDKNRVPIKTIMKDDNMVIHFCKSCEDIAKNIIPLTKKLINKGD